MNSDNMSELLAWIKSQAMDLGFSELRVTNLDVSDATPYLREWLAKGFHGDMNYMSRHAFLRENPQELLPEVLRVISVRMDYLAAEALLADAGGKDWRFRELQALEDPERAVISVYARGRDYHKVLRSRLQRLVDKIQEQITPMNSRVFVDSAPVLEVEFAKKSGIGWRGKHTLALNRLGGSMFFLGEIFIDIPLPLDEPISEHCGQCQACIDICPTNAITGPYQLDARRCISYLTIEHPGVIPVELRPFIGNRIYGCDDCQLICPWNKYAQKSYVDDFKERNALGSSHLIELFHWTAQEFDTRMQGSAIYRIGYERWVRNIVIALGNLLRAPSCDDAIRQRVIILLENRKLSTSDLVIEHINWALEYSKLNTIGR
jgi:epoxyqueuosine reductase